MNWFNNLLYTRARVGESDGYRQYITIITSNNSPFASPCYRSLRVPVIFYRPPNPGSLITAITYRSSKFMTLILLFGIALLIGEIKRECVHDVMCLFENRT